MNPYPYSFLKEKKPIGHYIFLTLIAALLITAAALGAFFYFISHGSTSDLYDFTVFQPHPSSAVQDAMKKIANPDREVRGVFIATVNNINFPSEPHLSADRLKAELDDLLDTVEGAGLNAIFFQVRPCSDAFYNSRYFPLSAYLTGSQEYPFAGGFDVFEYLVEQAHERSIAVHAWVNPLRVTYGSANAPAHDLDELGAINPARLHPEWTVAYDDGKIYYNAGLEEVRKLIVDGVSEIVEKYNVDGVMFDDYFYPYPVSGASFDDEETYLACGAGFDSVADWRRDNIDQIVKQSYEAVKAVSPDCLFGVAPFGIWQNDNGSNGGSDTTGLSAYSEIYCDALTWAREGYIDYLAPQLYWQFNTSAARFDVLTRWWSAQLEGTGVDLLVSHAAYRVPEWESSDELIQQVSFARSELSYRGSIFYGYEAIRQNELSLADRLAELYDYEIIYTDPVSNGRTVTVNSPFDGATVSGDHTYLIGTSDPSLPLYLDGRKLGRTKNGYFSAYVELNDGKNVFTLAQGDTSVDFTVYSGSSAGSGEKAPAVMEKPGVVPVSPTLDEALGAGSRLMLSAAAPVGSRVTATIGNETVTLYSTDTAPRDGEALYREVYTAPYDLPSAAEGEVLSVGEIVFTAEYDGKTYTASAGTLRVLGEGAVIPVIVNDGGCELKIAPNSWYYDDYTPASAGMADNAVSLDGGFYHLRMGGYVAVDAVTEQAFTVGLGHVTEAAVVPDKMNDTIEIRLTADEAVPLNGCVEDGAFVLTLYNVETEEIPTPDFSVNPLIYEGEVIASEQENVLRFVFPLYDETDYYGFDYAYTESGITVTLNAPIRLDHDSPTPLLGVRLILDAGHGGDDPGALGADPDWPEKALNLAIVTRAGEQLEALGAEVIYTRTGDTTVELLDRAALLDSSGADLCVSVHQNSMDYTADVTKLRGLLSLYFDESGRSLAASVSSGIASALNRYERDVTKERLAMVRNHKFPSALVEVGFMTSVEEYDAMINAGGIETAAQGLVDGILEWFAGQAGLDS